MTGIVSRKYNEQVNYIAIMKSTSWSQKVRKKPLLSTHKKRWIGTEKSEDVKKMINCIYDDCTLRKTKSARLCCTNFNKMLLNGLISAISIRCERDVISISRSGFFVVAIFSQTTPDLFGQIQYHQLFLPCFVSIP